MLGHHRSNIPFKGTRTYLTGADIYGWVAEVIKESGEIMEAISISFRRLTPLQLSIEPFAEVEKSPLLTGDFSVTSGGKVHRYGLIESKIPVAASVPYDEDGLVQDCVVEDRTITAPSTLPPCTPIDLAVAMTKRLHQRVFPEEKRKWIFVRLEMQRFFEETDIPHLKIELVHHLQTKFSKSTISTPQGPMGTIYFSVLG